MDDKEEKRRHREKIASLEEGITELQGGPTPTHDVEIAMHAQRMAHEMEVKIKARGYWKEFVYKAGNFSYSPEAEQRVSDIIHTFADKAISEGKKLDDFTTGDIATHIRVSLRTRGAPYAER